MADDEPKPIKEFRKIDSASPSEEEGKKIVEEALNRFKSIVAREDESRTAAVGDLIFIDQPGGEFNAGLGILSGNAIRTNKSSTGDDPEPPRYQLDRISPVIEEAVSDQRESQITIQVRGTGTKDKNLHSTFDGLIKNIEVVSDAQDAYDNMYDECQKSGYGGLQLVTEYADNSFEQNIRYEPIMNATQSLFFGPAKKATKEDALYAFHIWDIDLEEFKIQYPDAQHIEWPTSLNKLNTSWFNGTDKVLRLAAYWRKRPIKKEIIMIVDKDLNTGKQETRIIDSGEDLKAALAAGSQIVVADDGKEMRREVDTYQVERFIMSGLELLKGPQEWVGKYIPLIPEFGIRSVVNGKEIIRGKVRKGKDAQRIYDYTTSAIVQTAAKSGKDFHWLTPKQAGSFVDNMGEIDDDTAFVYYNHDSQEPGPPKKAQGPTVQQALIDQRTAAKEDIIATVGGTVGAMDGTANDPRSGEAIREGNVSREKGNSIYFANHIRAVGYGGLQAADLISKLWTGQQQRRMIKPDGTEEFITVNQTQQVEGKDVIINDLQQTGFDIVVDVGPAYASQRQQGADQLTKLAAENPAFAKFTPDLIAKFLDVEGSNELFERLRKEMILNGIIEATDEEKEELGLDDRELLIQELMPQVREEVMNETNIQLLVAQTGELNARTRNFNAASVLKGDESGKIAADIENTLAKVDETIQDTINKSIDGMTKLLENFIKKVELGIPLDLQDHDQRVKQGDNIDEQQQEGSDGLTSEMESQLEQLDEELEEQEDSLLESDQL